jgi:hypothetical protein
VSGASIASAFGRAARGFLKWYWKQSVVGMVMTTVALVVAANYLLTAVGVAAASRWELTTVLGMGLLLMAVAACFWRALVGNPNKGSGK